MNRNTAVTAFLLLGFLPWFVSPARGDVEVRKKAGAAGTRLEDYEVRAQVTMPAVDLLRLVERRSGVAGLSLGTRLFPWTGEDPDEAQTRELESFYNKFRIAYADQQFTPMAPWLDRIWSLMEARTVEIERLSDTIISTLPPPTGARPLDCPFLQAVEEPSPDGRSWTRITAYVYPPWAATVTPPALVNRNLLRTGRSYAIARYQWGPSWNEGWTNITYRGGLLVTPVLDSERGGTRWRVGFQASIPAGRSATLYLHVVPAQPLPGLEILDPVRLFPVWDDTVRFLRTRLYTVPLTPGTDRYEFAVMPPVSERGRILVECRTDGLPRVILGGFRVDLQDPTTLRKDGVATVEGTYSFEYEPLVRALEEAARVVR